MHGWSGKQSTCQCSIPGVRKIPWRRKWQPAPLFLSTNPMDRGAWQATVHGGHSQTRWSTSVKYGPKSSFGFLIWCSGKIQMNFLAHISSQGHSMVQRVSVRLALTPYLRSARVFALWVTLGLSKQQFYRKWSASSHTNHNLPEPREAPVRKWMHRFSINCKPHCKRLFSLLP